MHPSCRWIPLAQRQRTVCSRGESQSFTSTEHQLTQEPPALTQAVRSFPHEAFTYFINVNNLASIINYNLYLLLYIYPLIKNIMPYKKVLINLKDNLCT